MISDFNGSQHYWRPQLEDPQLSSFTKIAVDAPGFGLSTTHGEPWSFDVAAAAVLAILDRQLGDSDRRAVLIGDSMGGMHTSGRAALRDTERKKAGKRARIAGIVPCGTAAEEESVGESHQSLARTQLLTDCTRSDFVAGYEQDAVDFAKKCSGASPEQVAAHIDDFADNMCKAGYTESPDFSSAREYGRKIIADSLKMSLCNANGVLEGRHAGETMKLNTRILGHRKGLIPELAVRPSPIGDIRALVIHGTDDNAVSSRPRETGTPLTRCCAVSLRSKIPRAHSVGYWRGERRAVGRARRHSLCHCIPLRRSRQEDRRVDQEAQSELVTRSYCQ